MTMRLRVSPRLRRRWLTAVAAAAVVIGLSAARQSAAVIVLDADFDQGSLNELGSFAAGNVVTLSGRDNFNPGAWKWLYFSATGVANQQVNFRIDDDFATGGGDLVGHKMVYSYDQETWAFFDNNVRVASQNLFTFSNNLAFTQDRVYVAYGLPYPYARTADQAAALASHFWVEPTATADAALVLGRSPGGVDDLGRTIAPRPLYGFKISDPDSPALKAKIALVGGVHANETLGSFALEGLVDFLVGDSLEAAVLRKQAEFFVYPMVNPDGRFAGYNRSTVQRDSLDPNRFWAPPDYGGLDDVGIVGDAMIADISGGVDVLIDFHSDVAGKTGHYGNVLPQWQSHPLWQNFLQLEPSVDTNNALLEDFTTAKFGRDELGASFSITFETQFLPDENIDRFLSLGRNWGRAMFRALSVPADLNLDGDLDGQDWLLFAASSETDLAGLAPVDAYLRGDLDGDGVNSVLDFGIFNHAYEELHGGGSFAAMLLRVPEPGAGVIALLAALIAACAARRRRHVTIAGCRRGDAPELLLGVDAMQTFNACRFTLSIAALAMLAAPRALAADFESFLFNDPIGTELDGAANTANPGNAWTVDFDNLVPAEVDGGMYKITKDNNNAAPAVLNIANATMGARYLSVDFAGWAFRGFEAGELEELRFGFLDNDDGAFTGNVVTAQMQVRRNATTQGVELVGDAVGPGSTNLTRNVQLPIDQSTSFRMVLELNKTSNTYELFYNSGANPSQSLGMGNVSAARNGNSVRLFVNNNFGSDFTEFISVDRIAVTDVNPLTDLLTLEVNRTTGETKLINTTGSALAGLESYSILSPSGALNGAGWKTIAGNYDSVGNGSVDVDNAWSVSVNNVGELTEAVVAGNGGALTNGQQVVLSTAGGPWVKSPVEDLFMELRFAGGVTRSANVNFVGNGGERFETGDLNFDGSITVNDWTAFIANSETDLSGLAAPARYQRGDLDGDGVNSSFDFIVFKTAFEAANGAGSFEAMLAALPEPHSSALAALGAAALLRRPRRPAISAPNRRCSRTMIALIAAIIFSDARGVSAGILQDFTFNDANGTAIDSVVNSVNPSNAWLTQNNNVESFVNGGKFRINKQTVTGQVANTLDVANVTSGKAWLVAEIAGWNYTATASSPTERVRFGFLDNTDPVAAGSNTVTAEMNIDRIGDGTLQLNGMALGTGSGNVSATLPLGLVRNTPLTIVLELDKALDQYSVYYSDNAGPFTPLGTANLGASTLNAGDRDGNSIRFAFTGTYGDVGEFFDLDRLYLTDTSPLNVSTDALTLRVNSTTGAVAIVNDSDTPFSIDLYRIESSTNRLNPAGWNSLSDQAFGNVDGPDNGSTPGDGIGETWDEAGGSDAGVLSEMFLLGSSNFAANSDPVALGNAFISGTQPPLAFQYRNATTGALLTGNVEFVTGGFTPDADFDNNLIVDGADFLIWQRNLGVGSTNLTGDANGDGQVTSADLAIWKAQHGSPPPTAASAIAVPEPPALAIAVALAIAGASFRARKRQPEPET